MLHNVFTGDFNGDGFWDIGVTHTQAENDAASADQRGTWYIRYNDRKGSFSTEDSINYHWGNGSHNVFTGDFNHDGYWDIGVTDTETQSLKAWYIRYNTQSAEFSTNNSIEYPWNGMLHNVFSGDFNGDGYWDIGCTGTETEKVGAWYIRTNTKAGGF
jgi:hypothetical protein